MANPVLIAKLALVAADPKTWQKIIIACISIFIISAALLGSCGAMTFTDLGFDCSQLFSAKLNEYSAVFDSGARINDKLLYAVYAQNQRIHALATATACRANAHRLCRPFYADP